MVVVVAVCLAVAVAITARPPGAGWPWRLAFVVLMVGGSGLLVYLLRRWSPSGRLVLGVSVALRLVVFPMEPTLSDDGFRYVWDGDVQAQEGLSPYQFRPSDEALADLHDRETYRRMNSPDYYTVYPPASQLVFGMGSAWSGPDWQSSWWTLKAIITIVEFGGIIALIRTIGPAGAALYAWHPISVVEVAGQGHTEGLLVGALGLLLLTVWRRPAWVGTALACAGWVKLYPFALAPLVVPRGRAVVAFAVAATALAVPYASADAVDHVRQSLGLYLGTFDFYAAPYLVLKAALYPLLAVRAGSVAAGVLTAGWVAWVALLYVVYDGTALSARRTAALIVIGYAFAATTLHPWHLIPVLLLVPLLEYKNSLLWVISLSPITYLTYIWPPGHSVALVLGWGGATAIALWTVRDRLLGLLMQSRARQKWNLVRPFLPPVRSGGRLLDLGAGEGWVGALAAVERGLALTSVDVVRYGETAQPVELYDGRCLPYEDGTFDATLVVFVLHHAEHPEDVLREAMRVTRGPVLILETVWTSRRGKRWLERVDRWVNRLRSGGAVAEEPLDIRSHADWRALCTDLGFEFEVAEVRGGLHPRAIYRLGQGATTSRTEAAVAVRASTHSASS